MYAGPCKKQEDSDQRSARPGRSRARKISSTYRLLEDVGEGEISNDVVDIKIMFGCTACKKNRDLLRKIFFLFNLID